MCGHFANAHTTGDGKGGNDRWTDVKRANFVLNPMKSKRHTFFTIEQVESGAGEETGLTARKVIFAFQC